MALLEVARVAPAWALGDNLPDAREWHQLTKEKSTEIHKNNPDVFPKARDCYVYLNDQCVSVAASKKYRMIAPADVELYRFEHVRDQVHMLARPCGHMVLQVSVLGDTITAMSAGGNILFTKTFGATERVRVCDFKQMCKREMVLQNKLTLGSTLDLIRAGQSASSSSIEPNQPTVLRPTVVLKAGAPIPKQWRLVRDLHLRLTRVKR